LGSYGYRVRFAVFEGKVKQDAAVAALLRKSGAKFPMVVENISLVQLRQLIAAFPDLSPNVIFEKTSA
jgi:hypothetical protein